VEAWAWDSEHSQLEPDGMERCPYIYSDGIVV